MAYNNVIGRTDAASMIPMEYSDEILSMATEQSAVLRLARRLRDLARYQKTMPVISALPVAYFVNGDTGQKQTSEVNWTDKIITAEELAVIVPIPENVLADSEYPIWSQVQPLIAEAFGRAIDQAILYGTNAPSSWPDDIHTGAAAASHDISLASYSDEYEAILGETAGGADGLAMLVEADGYMVTGYVAHLSMRGKLRNVRDANGQPIFKSDVQGATRYALDGEPVEFPRNGSIDASTSLMIAGDWQQIVYAMRQDITWKLLTEAVIQDGAGNIVYNLAQQDMVAMRAVMRLGWQLPNPINRIQETEASRYPFSYMTS